LKKVTFVLGGCRSGKSGHAQKLAEAAAQKRIYIATCVPYDDEMQHRVAMHRRDRDHTWTTVEAPVFLPEAIAENALPGAAVLADCLTLWLTNLLLSPETSGNTDDHIRKLVQSLETARCPVFLVSNEVGQGIVPENKLARQFRDIVGFANQRVAAAADEVIWTAAGIPVKIK